MQSVYMPNEIPVCVTDANSGANCFVCDHSFHMHIFTLTLGRKLIERQLDLQMSLTDSTTMQRVGDYLLLLFSPNVQGIDSYGFLGFTNVPSGGQEEQTPGSEGTNALEQNTGGSSGDSSGKLILPLFIVAFAVFFLVVIAAFAVRRRSQDDKEMALSHVLLKDDDELEDTDMDKSTTYSAGAIMRDLAQNERFDDEVATSSDSIALTQVQHPPAYVLGEGDNATFVDDDDEVRFAGGSHHSDLSVTTGPTFVTSDLKKAMKDLEPKNTPQKPRGYPQDDTVDL